MASVTTVGERRSERSHPVDEVLPAGKLAVCGFRHVLDDPRGRRSAAEQNPPAQERAAALDEVARIANLRLADLVGEPLEEATATRNRTNLRRDARPRQAPGFEPQKGSDR